MATLMARLKSCPSDLLVPFQSKFKLIDGPQTVVWVSGSLSSAAGIPRAGVPAPHSLKVEINFDFFQYTGLGDGRIIWRLLSGSRDAGVTAFWPACAIAGLWVRELGRRGPAFRYFHLGHGCGRRSGRSRISSAGPRCGS